VRILMLHSRYDIRGGEDESTDAECKLLRSRGHQVDLLEAHNSAIGKEISRSSAAVATVWSSEWYRRVAERLQSKRYDVVHVQNTFPLISPSIYYAASKLAVPVVQAVRNYRFVCPSANLFRDGKYCDMCVEKTVKWPAAVHACYRGSLPGSAVVAGMSVVHLLAGTWREKVDVYAAISEFVKARLVQGGLPSDKIFVKPNFVDVDGQLQGGTPSGRHFLLYVGRISRDKGVHLLLESYEASGVDLPLKLVGHGDVQVPLSLRDRVHVLGPLPLAEVYHTMRQAICVVMPGAWPEPFGRVAIESFAQSTPVIAPRAGGLTEIVQDGVNGLLFEPGNVPQLTMMLRRVAASQDLLAAMGRQALLCYRRQYTPDVNYSKLMECYRRAGVATD
jgi:glycosyltransferase involved in cell wall biosynthesis